MSTPVIAYPSELPVSAARHEIADAIRDHQVVIVAGATGSGKTTQLPKICLELGRENIAHTQPRRLASQATGVTAGPNSRSRRELVRVMPDFCRAEPILVTS